MKDQIEQLERNLKDLKNAYEINERLQYEKSVHKVFYEGDIVSRGTEVGIVERPDSLGYMGVNLINGRRGFISKTRRNEWTKIDSQYYINTHEIKIELTGLEIQDLLYYIGPSNFNSNEAKSKLIDLLNSIK